MNVFFGILSGLTAACGFSLSYLFSRLFYEKSGKNPLHLLAISHVQMGMFSLLLFPFVWPDTSLSFSVIIPLAGATFFAMLGQASFFFTLKHSNPSQVTPLLAFKIVILAFASIFILQKNISLLQWCGICMCFGATFLLHFSGGSIALKGSVGILVTCIGYALADVFATMVIQQLASIGVTTPVLLGTCLLYAALGTFGIILSAFMWKDIQTFSVWKFTLYFSMTFFLADICLFTTFKLVGPVFGNIVQSTRGILSIFLAKIVAMKGMHYLEQDMTQSTIVRRLLAASLFSIAIGLYVLG